MRPPLRVALVALSLVSLTACMSFGGDGGGGGSGGNGDDRPAVSLASVEPGRFDSSRPGTPIPLATLKAMDERQVTSTFGRPVFQRDENGEYFDVQHRKDVRVDVIDVRPVDRHLLLLVREPGRTIVDETKSKYLCGHDERSWFVAAIPESAAASNVQEAMDALKPQAVWDAIAEFGLPMSERNRRKTKANKYSNK